MEGFASERTSMSLYILPIFLHPVLPPPKTQEQASACPGWLEEFSALGSDQITSLSGSPVILGMRNTTPEREQKKETNKKGRC